MNAGIVDIVTATTGEHVPNAFFDAIGLTDEWIRRRTGVAARWWMDDDEALDDVAARVCAPLVARHRDIRIAALVVVSSSAGGAVPGIAQRVATKAGLPHDILAFDMSAACSGFIYGLINGLTLCDGGDGSAVVVCCVEAMSRMLDKTDRNTGPLFGDGAGAVLIAPRPAFRKHRWHAGSDGAGADLMRGQVGQGIQLDGIRVYHRAVRTMTETAKILQDGDVEPSIVIGHQANSRILQRVRDEAHRFAITYHRQKRSTRMTASALDGVPGLEVTDAADRSAAELGTLAVAGYLGLHHAPATVPWPRGRMRPWK